MSLSEQTMLDLMAYADGELEGGAAKRIEKLVARDNEARKVLESMQTLSECVRIVGDDRPTPKVDVDDIADSVMKTISTLPMPVDEERPRKLMRAGAAGVVSFAIAIAAGWALFAPMESPDGKDQVAAMEALRAAQAAQKAPAQPPAVNPNPPEQLAVKTPAGGVELDHVESPSHEVSVFYVPALSEGENASTSVVVWIGDNQRGL